MRNIFSLPSWIWPLLLIVSLFVTTAGIYSAIGHVQGVITKVFSKDLPSPVAPPSFDRTQFSRVAPYIGCTVSDSEITCH